ncbi:hypothetical protein CTEN210_02697 [Chaetoceros tenuissimus]|uniref:Uncharacterized protein n=1 Tax=Chaetoceros tenuissimus TaxID=426638 RepID=A0AAD3CI05_9STRA|nr:hypothetical protein CTEN210_02697 [Chaetoceros tenuissimus]
MARINFKSSTEKEHHELVSELKALKDTVKELLEKIDKVPYLQVFLHRVRHGFYAANKNPISARSAEDYIRSIGQTYLELGEQDPRLNFHDNLDFRLARMIKSYKKKDPPPNRVKHVPLSVIRRIVQIAFSGNSFNQHATADMIIIAFFFLLHPGEYSFSNTDSDRTLFEKKVVVSSDETTLDLTEVPLRRKSKARKYMRGKVLQKVSVYSIRKLVWLKKCFKKRKNLKRLYEVVDDAYTTDLCESTISNENENVMESSQECKSTKEILELLGDAYQVNHDHILKAHACIIDQANTIKNLRMEVANISNANVCTTSSSNGDSFFSAFDDGFSIDA